MRAAVLRRFGGPVQIEDVCLDGPRAHEVKVRIAAVGLCRSDLHCRAGGFPVFKLPMVLGHEAAGIVTDIGPRVTKVSEGSHVVATWN
jgi:S-(hydroxymethyl)glutathione dehydrogenase/alcohol dehydrogenase